MHLNQSQKVLFGLLNTGLWNMKLELPEGFDDWNEVIRLAKHQSILGVVAKAALSDKNVASSLPGDLRLKMKSYIVSNVFASNHLDEVLLRLIQAFGVKGIEPVLLKGKSLAINYPYPELRQCGDIDIYIYNDQLYAAYDVLESFADRIDNRLYIDCGKHFTAVSDDVEIEVHRYVSHAVGRLKLRFSKFAVQGLTRNLNRIDVGEQSIATPETTFNAYYIFDHLFEHFMTSGVGLRQMCDWMLFLHKNREAIDSNYLHHILSEMDLMRPWKIFGAVLVDYMGMPASDFPFYDSSVRVDTVLKYILQDGNFGKETAYYKNTSKYFLVKKLKSFKWHIRRGVQMGCLFPKHELRHFIYLIINALRYIKVHFQIKLDSKTSHGR